MRSPAAFFVLAASLTALPARAQEPPAAPAAAPAPLALAPLRYPAPYAFPPPWWTVPPPPTERRSKGMMITGIAFFGASGVVTSVGLGLFASAESSSCGIPDEVSPPAPGPRHPRSPGPRGGESLGSARQALDLCGDPSKVNLGLGVLAAGVLLGGVGIPLFVLGNQKARAHPSSDAARMPALRLGAGSAGLRWSF